MTAAPRREAAIRIEQLPLPLDDAGEVSVVGEWCQRWRHGQHRWRHRHDGGFDPRRYRVEPIPETAARPYVCAHHYTHSYPAAVHRLGLVDVAADRLAGVAVFGIPAAETVLTRALPSLRPYTESVVLSRFILDDSCLGNSESWFLARCFEQLLAGTDVRGVVSFADPMPRRTAAGHTIMPGHVGTIYQASNASYTGRGTAHTILVLPDGSVLNNRSAQKVRRSERGHRYVETRLVQLGATARDAGQDPAAWLRDALDEIGAHRVRHRGPHRYVFRLGRTSRHRARIPLGVPDLRPYPKHTDLAIRIA